MKPLEPIPWMNDAACSEVGGDIFFIEARASSRPAKRICAGCPVATECLTYAQTNFIDDGIFGGLSPMERRKLRRKGRAENAA